MAGSVELEWAEDALADLDRFAAFLHDQSPEPAATVAEDIIAKAEVLSRHPKWVDRPPREEYRQVAMQVLGGVYVFQYRYEGNRVVILRIFTVASSLKSR